MSSSRADPIEDSVGAFVPGGRFVVDPTGPGPLAGLSFAAKDIIDVAGWVTGCGNPDWADSHPAAARHASAVERLLGAGARLVGKTVTDELAFSVNGQNVHYGTPRNVNAPGRIPGGSSSGSAAAVAAGLVDLALGTDTGGSVRVPASYCGVFGLRPTHGRVALDGVMPLAPSFDTLGWFAPDAERLRRLGEVLLAETDAPAPPVGLLVAEDAFALLDGEARAALAPGVERLRSHFGSAQPVEIGAPLGGLAGCFQCFRTIQGNEAWRAHGAWIEARRPRFGSDIAARFEWARTVGDADAAAARRARASFAAHLGEMLAGGRVLCLPTSPGIAPRLDTPADELLGQRERVITLTSPAALAGLPQATIPLGTLAGCPLGLSLMAGPDADLSLLAFVDSFCAAADRPTRTDHD